MKLKNGMNGHIATIHEDKKPFKCDICDASFGQKGSLNKHMGHLNSHIGTDHK